MASKLVSLLLTLAALGAWCEGAPRHHGIQKRSMRLCGRNLVDALAAVCESEYYDPNQMSMRKRNYAYLTSDPSSSWENTALTEFDGFMDPQTALDFLAVQLPRNPRGVADECCVKSCSFHQLLSYCGGRRSVDDRKK